MFDEMVEYLLQIHLSFCCFYRERVEKKLFKFPWCCIHILMSDFNLCRLNLLSL